MSINLDKILSILAKNAQITFFRQDNLMRKLACKTLMEILPADVGTKISEEIKEKKLSVDFDTVVGLVVG